MKEITSKKRWRIFQHGAILHNWKKIWKAWVKGKILSRAWAQDILPACCKQVTSEPAPTWSMCVLVWWLNASNGIKSAVICPHTEYKMVTVSSLIIERLQISFCVKSPMTSFSQRGRMVCHFPAVFNNLYYYHHHHHHHCSLFIIIHYYFQLAHTAFPMCQLRGPWGSKSVYPAHSKAQG